MLWNLLWRSFGIIWHVIFLKALPCQVKMCFPFFTWSPRDFSQPYAHTNDCVFRRSIVIADSVEIRQRCHQLVYTKRLRKSQWKAQYICHTFGNCLNKYLIQIEVILTFSCLNLVRIFISLRVLWQYVWCSNGDIFLMATFIFVTESNAEL